MGELYVDLEFNLEVSPAFSKGLDQMISRGPFQSELF